VERTCGLIHLMGCECGRGATLRQLKIPAQNPKGDGTRNDMLLLFAT
jgi:hypothetical protein